MDRYRALVKNDLDKIEKKLSNIISISDKEVLNDTGKFVNNGSKRIRALITLLYIKGLNSDLEINNDIIQILAAGELIHNASLLHDDVIDNSDFRRGKETVFSKFGSKMSIVAGDYLVSIAVKELMKINNSDVLNLFLTAVENMSIAEIFQFSKRGENISIEEYIKIAEGKTASLFEAILESSVLMLKFSSQNAKKFGKFFGILFQINNDLQKESLRNDEYNDVKTILNILGIEKTQIFKDNYKEEIKNIMADFEENKYKKAIEDLIEGL